MTSYYDVAFGRVTCTETVTFSPRRRRKPPDLSDIKFEEKTLKGDSTVFKISEIYVEANVFLWSLSLLTVNIKLDSLWTNLKVVTDLCLAESGTSAVDQSCSTPGSGRRRPGWRRHRLVVGRRSDSAPRCGRWRRACRASSARTRWATPRRLQRPSIPPYRNDNDKIRLLDPFTWRSFLRYVL